MSDIQPGVAKDHSISANKDQKKNKKSPSDKTARPGKNIKNSAPRVWFSSAEYQLRKSLPPQLPRRPTDIYLACSEGRELLEQQARAVKLLQEGDTVWLHSLGSNIPKCITLVNKLSQELEKLEVENFTHTWELSDNWASLEEEIGPRYNSGLHVKLKIGQ